MKSKSFFIIYLILIIGSCDKDQVISDSLFDAPQRLTIFFVNDQHGQLDNFAKIKHIVDEELKSTGVLLVCGGDMFSGNPVVDNHQQKGYPIIDVMNSTGFDVSVVGNHEFDYGEDVLDERIIQSEFDWVCANIDVSKSDFPKIASYITLSVDDLDVTFLGLVETNGKKDITIPSTHPWKVRKFAFSRPEAVVSQFVDLKENEGSDLLIALTHLGHSGYGRSLGDFELATQFSFFDLIIGGHSHCKIDTVVNKIPVFQAGSYLKYMGKIELEVKDGKIQDYHFELVNLNDYSEFDASLKTKIEDYNDLLYLKEVIGYSENYLDHSQVGCFYADALRGAMNVDVAFQNTGGIRSGLDIGDITKREIFEIDPFNNGTIKYRMTVGDIKKFLQGSGSGFYYSGVKIEQIGPEIVIKNSEREILVDDTELLLGINDYIPAVHDHFFPPNGEVLAMTSAESLIYYLQRINDQVSYSNCTNYFRYE